MIHILNVILRQFLGFFNGLPFIGGHSDWLESYMNSNTLYKLYDQNYAAFLSKVIGLLLFTPLGGYLEAIY